MPSGAATVGFAQKGSVQLLSEIPVGVGSTLEIDIVGNNFVELGGGVIDLMFTPPDIAGIVPEPVIDDRFDFWPYPGEPADPGKWLDIGFDVFSNEPARGNFVIATLVIGVARFGTTTLSILGSSQFFSTTDELAPETSNLTIQAVPLPAAGILFVSAFGVFGVGSRQRKKKRRVS